VFDEERDVDEEEAGAIVASPRKRRGKKMVVVRERCTM
jgi:hypothetical protein